MEAESGATTTPSSWIRLNKRSNNLLEEALESIEEPSHVSMAPEVCKRKRRSLLDVIGRDEAWLADCEVKSHYSIVTLPFPRSWHFCHQPEAPHIHPCPRSTVIQAAVSSSLSQSPQLGIESQTVETEERPRRGLTKGDAILIYLLQLGPKDPQKANTIARHYNISPKAVRDVWAHKSWVSATTPFLPLVHGWRMANSSQCRA